MPPILVAAIGAAALFLFWRYAAYRRTAVAKVPGPKCPSVVLGNLVDFANSHGATSASIDWFREYGSVCRFKGFLGRDLLQVVDPKAIAFMLSQGTLFEKDFADKPRIAAIFGQGLHSSIGKHTVAPILNAYPTAQQITPLASIFQKSAVEVKDRWVNNIKANDAPVTEINMGYDFSLGFLNALGEGAFGYDFNAFDHESQTPLFKAMMYIDSVSSQRTYKQILLESVVDQLPTWFLNVIFELPLAAGKPLKKQIDIMRAVAGELFNLGVQDAQSDDAVSSRNDLLSVLIKANMTAQKRYQLSQSEVQAQLMTFVTAGLSTVLSTHTQLMRQIIIHKEVQAKLRAEMLALGDHPTVDQLESAPYLELVVREALRMTDFVPLERIAQKDTVLPLAKPLQLTDGTIVDALPIKKGQSLHIPITAVSRNPDRYGADADHFNPDRWSGEKGESLKNYHGLGPGSWNGMYVVPHSWNAQQRRFAGSASVLLAQGGCSAKFGLLEIKIFTHLLLTTFNLEPGSSEWTPKVSLLERAVV